MNEDKFKDEINALLPKSLIPQDQKPPQVPQTPKPQPGPFQTMPEDHPLHMLDNQADPETKPKIVLQKPIRTYESDVADALANKKTSVMTMAIAENQRRTGEEGISNKEPSHMGQKIFTIILSIVLIATGLGGGYYLYLKSPLAPQPPAITKQTIPSLVTPDSQKLLAVGALKDDQLIRTVSNALQGQDAANSYLYEFILTQTVGSTTMRITGPDFISRLNLSMPDTLVRSLTNGWMLGIYGAEDQKLPFVILKTDFFQNAFAGMLKWEPDMPDELATLLNYREKALAVDPNSTSSIASYFTIRGTFEDRTILNRDVREFKNERGELLVLYSFIDKDTLLITTSEAALMGLIDRIEKQNYIR